MRPLGLLALGLLVGVEPALAQDIDLLSRIDAETAEAVTPILEEARRDSLPMRALESKVLEGVAKRVPPARIGQAVAQLAGELRTVRGELRSRMPSESLLDVEIVAAARAVRQGASFDALDEVWEARTGSTPLEVPVTVLGELVRRGVPVAEASAVMGHVVRSEVPLQRAAQIPGELDGVLGRVQSPAEALAEALRMLDIPNPPGRRPGG